MTPGSKALLLVLTVAGVGTAGYFLTRKSKKELQGFVLSKSGTIEERQRMAVIVQKMTRQELVDTYRAFQLPESTKPENIDPALKARIALIGAKYNIFT